MKIAKLLVLGGLAVASGILGAQTQERQRITDDAGFVLFFQDVYVEQSNPDEIQADFRGNPLEGESRKQGITFRMQRMQGSIRRTANDELRLKDANLSGNVRVTLGRTTATPAHTLTTELVRVRDEEERTVVTAPQAFTLRGETGTQPYQVTGLGLTALFGAMGSEAPPLRQVTVERNARLTMSGNGGTNGMTAGRLVMTPADKIMGVEATGGVVLTRRAESSQSRQNLTVTSPRITARIDTSLRDVDQLREARAPGEVTLRLEFMGNEPGKSERTSLLVTATGRNLVLNGATRTLTMSQVQTEGLRRAEGKSVFGTLKADTLTITFDEQGEVKSLRMAGGPGTATVNESPQEPANP